MGRFSIKMIFSNLFRSLVPLRIAVLIIIRGEQMIFYHSGLIVLLSSLFLIVSCNDNPVQQYGTTMTQSYKSAQKLDATVNLQQVQKSIQEFYAANGRYPADLNELSTTSGLTLKSDNYIYNPENGTLTEKR
jgi:hypothetical protein